MSSKISVANLVMLAGAVVTLIFSFFAYFKFGGESVNAWDGDALAFATTVPAILAIVMAIWIGLELAGVSLPEQVLTFDRNQLKATWAISAAGIMLSWISADVGSTDKGIGFWFMLIGSLAMAVGAVMALLGKGTETVDIPGVGGTSTGTAGTAADDMPPPPPPA